MKLLAIRYVWQSFLAGFAYGHAVYAWYHFAARECIILNIAVQNVMHNWVKVESDIIIHISQFNRLMFLFSFNLPNFQILSFKMFCLPTCNIKPLLILFGVSILINWIIWQNIKGFTQLCCIIFIPIKRNL